MKKLILFVLFIHLILSSCKKGDNSESSKTFKIIADKKWKLSAHDFYIRGDTFTRYAILPSCLKDNLWTLKSDKTNELDEGLTKCDTFDIQTKIHGNWELRSDDKELYVKGVLSSGTSSAIINEITATILEATPNSLIIQYTNNDGVINKASYSAE